MPPHKAPEKLCKAFGAVGHCAVVIVVQPGLVATESMQSGQALMPRERPQSGALQQGHRNGDRRDFRQAKALNTSNNKGVTDSKHNANKITRLSVHRVGFLPRNEP